MGVHKCRVGLIWSLLFTVVVTAVPKYWELRLQSIPPVEPPLPAITPAPPPPEVVENTIQKNRTLVATLVDYEVPVEIANEIADLIKPVFDVRKVRFGNPFRLEKENDGTLKKFEYKIDDERMLKVQKGTDAYEASVEKLDLETRESTITAEIHSSLWEALDDVPKREYLATELAS